MHPVYGVSDGMDAICRGKAFDESTCPRVPGDICADITHCRSDIWNCMECVHFTPEKEQFLYFERRAKSWELRWENLSATVLWKLFFQRLWVGSSKSVRKCGKRHPHHETEIIIGNDSKARIDETANNWKRIRIAPRAGFSSCLIRWVDNEMPIFWFVL